MHRYYLLVRVLKYGKQKISWPNLFLGMNSLHMKPGLWEYQFKPLALMSTCSCSGEDILASNGLWVLNGRYSSSISLVAREIIQTQVPLASNANHSIRTSTLPCALAYTTIGKSEQQTRETVAMTLHDTDLRKCNQGRPPRLEFRIPAIYIRM